MEIMLVDFFSYLKELSLKDQMKKNLKIYLIIKYQTILYSIM